MTQLSFLQSMASHGRFVSAMMSLSYPGLRVSWARTFYFTTTRTWQSESTNYSHWSAGAHSMPIKAVRPQHCELSAGSADNKAVIVIEAFGASDNQVLARSWCSHFAFSAVVADIEETCMACSVRQAYVLCVSVVILTCGQGDEAVREVDRSPRVCRYRHCKKPVL